ncbi:MAG: DUF2255 family protein [Vicinamibacteraceae bacterium]
MAGRERLLPKRIVSALDTGKFVWIRAGTNHRFIGIWVVVVDGRAFVRSWSLAPRSWYRTFVEKPHGAIKLEKDGREVSIRAVPVKGKRLNDAISEAYLAKYNTRASLPYAKDLGSAKSRGATMELRPESKVGARTRSPSRAGVSRRRKPEDV